MAADDSGIAATWLDLIGAADADPERTYRESSTAAGTTTRTGRRMRDDLALAASGDASAASRYLVSDLPGHLSGSFAAEQVALQRQVTVKTATDPAEQDSLRLEAWLTGYLEHPNIATVHDAGDDFVVLQALSGATLASIGAGMDREALVDCLLRVCDALEHAHGCGLLHRDLKPAQVTVGDHGEVVVTDWSLAATWAAAPVTVAWAPQVTASNACAGTPAYCAPEVAAGDHAAIGPATDIFAFGSLLWTCLNRGVAPFAAADARTSLRRAVANRPGAMSADAPAELVDLCRHCMALDPGDRPDWPRIRADLQGWLGQAESQRQAERLFQAVEGLLRQDPDYAALRPIVALCDRGLALDPGHAGLQAAAQRARSAFGRQALAAGDLAWAAAQLTEDPDGSAAVAAALADRRQQDQQRRRLRQTVRYGGLLVVAAVFLLALFIADADRREAARRVAAAEEILATAPALPPPTADDWPVLAQQRALALQQALGLAPTETRFRQRMVGLTEAALARAEATGRIGIAGGLVADLVRRAWPDTAPLDERLRAVASARDRVIAERRQWITDLIDRATESIPWALADPRVARDHPDGRRHEDDLYGVRMEPTVSEILSWDGPELADLIAPLADHPLPVCRRIAGRVASQHPDLRDGPLRAALLVDPDPAVRVAAGGSAEPLEAAP